MMLVKIVILVGAAAISCAGATPEPAGVRRATEAGMSLDSEVWKRVASTRTFFGHQSVGSNILEGLGELQRDVQQPVVRIVNLSKESTPQGPALMHALVGENGNPLSKIHAFRTQLESGLGTSVDVAALKLCFWDVRGDADVQGIFREYIGTIATLRERFPHIRFVHITVPLFARDGDWRAGVRRLLGKPVPRTLENAKRHELSELMRTAYRGREPLFDLAGLQAAKTTENGIPYLAAEYTNDGGHLNALGRRLAAEGFVEQLADAKASHRPTP